MLLSATKAKQLACSAFAILTGRVGAPCLSRDCDSGARPRRLLVIPTWNGFPTAPTRKVITCLTDFRPLNRHRAFC
jgi:hypothetical protein